MVLYKKASFWWCKQHIKSEQFVRVREKSRADGIDMLEKFPEIHWKSHRLLSQGWETDSVGLVRLCRLCGYVACPPASCILQLHEVYQEISYSFSSRTVQSKGETISDLDNEIEAKENSIPLPFPLLDTNVYSEQVLTFHSSPPHFPFPPSLRFISNNVPLISIFNSGS